MANETYLTEKFFEKKRWVFFGFPFTFTSYRLDHGMVILEKGFLTRTTDECYLYKVQDVKLTRSLMERIFGLGTLVLYTGDTTDKSIEFIHIKNSISIKDALLNLSEEARKSRRTANLLDISADADIQ